MELGHTFIFTELPYQKLEQLGISKKQADNLPMDYKNRLLNGELTPLVIVSMKNHLGETVSVPMKMRMENRRDGSVGLTVFPARKEMSRDARNAFGLSHAEESELMKGNIILKTEEMNGIKVQQYLQLDPETKTVISRAPKDVKMLERLQTVEKVNDIELGLQQKQQAKEGKPIELNVGGEKVSVGINLQEPKGFKVITGDLKEWERQKQIKYDIQHPEYVGIVQTDENRWEYRNFLETQKMGQSNGQTRNFDRQNGMKL